MENGHSLSEIISTVLPENATEDSYRHNLSKNISTVLPENDRKKVKKIKHNGSNTMKFESDSR